MFIPVKSIRLKIVFIFSIITLALIAVMARISYLSVKNIYLTQVREQVNVLSAVVAERIDLRFLDFIDPETQSLGQQHYQTELLKSVEVLQLTDVFIFDSSGVVLVKTQEQASKSGLLLNLLEIQKLKQGQSFNSLPFKADDGQWYLWNFRRLNNKYFVGIRENTHRLAELDKLATLFMSIAAIGIILVLIAGWFVGKSIAAPINRLVRFSSEIGGGNLRAKAPEQIQGELAELRNALIHMREGLLNHHTEKENMLAQIAHELRNPLGGIALLAGLIQEDTEPESKNAQYAQGIVSETEGLKGQISAYLNFSRPVQTKSETIDWQSFFNSIQDDYQKKLKEQKIDLEIQINNSTVLFDSRHLKQIVSNLLDNSINATGPNGSISIQVNSEQLTISDTGAGIEPEKVEKIFEPFYTTSESGTGLGLAICRKLCSENGATISVLNNAPNGCTFNVTFEIN